jgi:succinyl-CoA synthetase alpha subunit
VVVVVGKPPGPDVARRLAEALNALGKPSVVYTAGATVGMSGGPHVHRAATLEDAALAAVALARGQTPRGVEFSRPADEIERLVAEQARALGSGQRFVRGVYSGGTLAWEAVALLGARLSGVLPGVRGEGDGHRVVDLGDDVHTLGRPHPMIDGSSRRERIAREAADPGTAVVLLDVVLGYGAHPDPTAELGPELEAARRAAAAAGRGLAVVASVIGTEADPQGRSRQAAALRQAGAVVMDSNAQAARLAALVAARAGNVGR